VARRQAGSDSEVDQGDMPSTAPDPVEPDAELAEAPPGRGVKRRLTTAAKAFVGPAPASLVALVGGFVALLYTVSPSLKPDPRDTVAVTAKVLSIERVVTRDDWRRRVSKSDAAYRALVRRDNKATGFPLDDPCGNGGSVGFIANVETEAIGFKRRELTVRGTLIDARTSRRIAAPNPVLAQFPIDSPTAKSVARVFVFDPGRPEDERFLIRVEVLDGEDNVIGLADSKPFKSVSPDEYETVETECVPA
jgi:hypothetical protein